MALPRSIRRMVSRALALTLLISAVAVAATAVAPRASAASAEADTALTLTFTTPPGADVSTAYTDTLTATGGSTPYTWSISAGALPTGITLGASNGILAGTPSGLAKTYSFTVMVTDSTATSVTKPTTLVLAAVTSLSFAAPPGADIGGTYTDTLTVVGGTSTYTWSIISGSPPAGISIGSSTGVLSGTASGTAGTYNFTVKVVDKNLQSATQATSITLVAGPGLSFPAPPSGEINSAYSDTLAVTGGVSPYTWTVSVGTLPTNISLAGTTGVLSGTASATAGTSSFTIKVSDRNGQTATEATSITIAAGPALSFATPPSADIHAAYTDTLTASGGTGPYTWSVTGSGTPPAGISLTASTGVLSGTPTATGTANFAIKVTDANGQTATEVTSLTVVAVPTLSFAAPPGGEVGASYSDTLTVTGGTAPFTWSVSAGTLPAGVTLGSSTGVLSGTPTTAGAPSFTIAVSDVYSQTATEATSLTVVAGPTLSFAAPPGGEVSAFYTDTLTVNGGTSAFAWSVSAGTLPAGLTLASSTGVLSGTPTAAGTSHFTVKVTDANSQTATEATAVIIVAAAALSFPGPPSAEINSFYTDTLTTSGGTAPFTWSVSAGTLPAGITLGASTGVLSGTPTATGTASFTVEVSDAESETVTEGTAITVVAGPSLSYGAPPPGEINSGYTDTLTVSGGIGPYTWSVSSGTLPAGISIGSSTGVLSGTPTATGTASFTVEVTDVNGQTATEATSVTVVAGPALSFPTPPTGEIDSFDIDTLTVSGGIGPYTWSVSSGTLPAGISIGSSTGVLSGTPTATGTASFTVKVTDVNSQTATEATSLTVVAEPTLSFVPPDGEINSAYTDTLTATSGIGPYTWAVSSGTLPAGLTLSSAGVLSGTPTATGTASFTVEVTDAEDATATEATTITVFAGPALSFPTPPNGAIHTSYTDQLTLRGGTAPYTWSVSGGTLPAGVTLGATTGILSGTPTIGGIFHFTVKVADSSNRTATEATTLMVAPSTAVTFSAAAVRFGKPVAIIATMNTSAASGSVTFTDLLSTGPQSGQTVTLGTATLTTGQAVLTVDLPAFGTNAITATYSGDSTYAPETSPEANVQAIAYNGEVLINQFRLSGPGGANDQYVELYNTGPAVSLTGFQLSAASGAAITLPGSAPILPTAHTYLISGGSYSLSGVAVADVSATNLGSAGLLVTAPDGAATATDAVGFSGAPAGFFSGTPLPALSGTPTDQYAWVRLETNGIPTNTSNNAVDFKLASTTGGVIGGVQSTLGSPSPLGSGSPSQSNGTLQSALLDPTVAATAAPNVAYVPGSPGLLTVRRTITNSSASNVTSAELRITRLSEANGAPEPGGPQPSNPAELRIIDPGTSTSQVTTAGGVVTVENLSVGSPADASPGGGLDTTLSVPLPGGLAAGASISIAVTFAVDQVGIYWFSYDVDALSPSSAPFAPGPGASGPALAIMPPWGAPADTVRSAGGSGALS
jgi:hypothetical protein